MLKNHLRIAFRNIVRNPIYSVINIGGLALGLATSLLIGLWVIDELSFNRFHKNIDNLYHVRVNATINEGIRTWAGTTYFAYEELKSWTNQFENVTISSGQEPSILLSTDEKKINRAGRFVSPEFLKMFQFELLHGKLDNLLTDPHSIIVSETTAKTLFGNDDPINKILKINNKEDVKVTGVIRDVPTNSSFQFDFLVPFNLYPQLMSWVEPSMNTPDNDDFEIYVELKPTTDIDLVNSKIKNIVKKHTTWLNKELFLYPMNRWHLHAEFQDGKEAENDHEDYVFGFSIISIGILIMASINFMNLSTARSERRAREVGIRKIAGSQRKELIIQFIRESILITMVAYIAAMVFVELCLPLYNSIVGKHLFINYTSIYFWIGSIILILFTGTLSGSYRLFSYPHLNLRGY